jgi:peroxiredoxin
MVTGPDGRYFLRVPAGKQHLFLASTPSLGFFLPARSECDLTVKDEETVTLDFRLPRRRLARPVRGRVLAPDGSPGAGAEVVVTPSDRSSAGTVARQADANGAFTLEAELVALPVTLRARHAGMATIKETAVTEGDEVTLRLREQALVTLSGRVTDTAGRPIAGAAVELSEQTYDFGMRRAKAVADGQGRYLIASLWPDARYSIGATAEGYGKTASDLIEGLRPGETRPLAPLTLRKADRSVAGRVVDASGDPVAGVVVSASGRETRDQNQTTDRQGRFRFDGVVDETIALQSRADPKRWTGKRVPAGEMDVLLVLPPEAGRGRAMLDDGLTERFASLQGRKAPPLSVVAWVNSAPRTLEQLRGQVVLIDFWGMGCGPCVASLTGVQRTAELFAKKGVVVIGLHDASGPAPQLREFARTHRLTYPLAVDAPDDRKNSPSKTFGDYGVRAIPSVAIIGRDGNVAYLGPSLAEAVGVMGSLLERAQGAGK